MVLCVWFTNWIWLLPCTFVTASLQNSSTSQNGSEGSTANGGTSCAWAHPNSINQPSDVRRIKYKTKGKNQVSFCLLCLHALLPASLKLRSNFHKKKFIFFFHNFFNLLLSYWLAIELLVDNFVILFLYIILTIDNFCLFSVTRRQRLRRQLAKRMHPLLLLQTPGQKGASARKVGQRKSNEPLSMMNEPLSMMKMSVRTRVWRLQSIATTNTPRILILITRTRTVNQRMNVTFVCSRKMTSNAWSAVGGNRSQWRRLNRTIVPVGKWVVELGATRVEQADAVSDEAPTKLRYKISFKKLPIFLNL